MLGRRISLVSVFFYQLLIPRTKYFSIVYIQRVGLTRFQNIIGYDNFVGTCQVLDLDMQYVDSTELNEKIPIQEVRIGFLTPGRRPKLFINLVFK